MALGPPAMPFGTGPTGGPVVPTCGQKRVSSRHLRLSGHLRALHFAIFVLNKDQISFWSILGGPYGLGLRVRDSVTAAGSLVREDKRDVVLAVPADTLGGYNVGDRCFFKCRWPALAARKGLMQAFEWQTARLAMLLQLHVLPCSTKSCG